MKPQIKYVVGFRFSGGFEHVALIRKNKPAWQAGLLNGIGGKIEAEESAKQAMAREFEEETGCATKPDEWSLFCTMQAIDGSWSVDCLAMCGDVRGLNSMESEPIEIHSVRDMHPLRGGAIENIPWLIAMAIDHLQDGRPHYATITYPK